MANYYREYSLALRANEYSEEARNYFQALVRAVHEEEDLETLGVSADLITQIKARRDEGSDLITATYEGDLVAYETGGYGNVELTAQLLSVMLAKFHPEKVIGFSYAEYQDAPNPEGFGGGIVKVRGTGYVTLTTDDLLSKGI